MLHLRRAAALAVVAGTGLAAVTGVGSAAAAPSGSHPLHVVRTLPGNYLAPLQFAVSDGKVAVADSAASALYLVGHKDPIALGPKPTANPEQSGDLAGVAIKEGYIAYTETQADHRNTYLTVLKHGHRVLRVNLGRYERQHNPDQVNRYGVADPSKLDPSCKAALDAGGIPITYRGQKDSHAYAVTGISHGAWLVADAGGNDVLKVDRNGRISTFAVLPPQPVTITSELATMLGAPSSCVGITYRFEPVPTDVEVMRGHVWATTLPGGAGGLGSVYRIGWNGHTKRVATGFQAATNLAVTPGCRIYVVELGVGVFTPGKHGPKLVASLPGAAAVEWADGRLYASTAPLAATEGKDTSPGHVVVLG